MNKTLLFLKGGMETIDLSYLFTQDLSTFGWVHESMCDAVITKPHPTTTTTPITPTPTPITPTTPTPASTTSSTAPTPAPHLKDDQTTELPMCEILPPEPVMLEVPSPLPFHSSPFPSSNILFAGCNVVC